MLHRKKILKIVAYLFVLIGITGFVAGVVISSGTFKYKYELPLGDIQGFVVDDSGNVYVGLAFYGTVQVYDRSGKYLRNWKVDNDGGIFNIDLAKDQNLLISVTRGDMQILYDKYGNLLKEEKIPYIYSKTERNIRYYSKIDGSKYELQGLIFKEIVITNPNEKVIVSQNIILELFKGPRVWLFWPLGSLLLSFLKRDNTNYI